MIMKTALFVLLASSNLSFSVNILTTAPIQLNQRRLCNLPYGFGSRILKVPSTSKKNESENIFSFKIPENLEPSEFIQNAEIRVEVASHHAGSLENLVNKTIGVRFVNEKQEIRKLRFSGNGQASPAGVSRSGQRLQRDTSNFQHDMHSSENEKGELNEQNVLRAINKTIVSRLTHFDVHQYVKQARSNGQGSLQFSLHLEEVQELTEVSIIMVLMDYSKIDCDDPKSWLSAADLATNRYNRGAPRKSKQKPRKVPAYTRFRSAMKRNCCQVRSFTVDLTRFYDDSLIAPRTLNIGRCGGNCHMGVARAGMVNMSDHAYIQSFKKGYRPKCVATELKKTPFLWKNPSGYYEVTSQKVVVDRCGCF